jgi:hypothetical protein
MLMAYRTIGAVELDWAKALNMVDIVFHDNKEIKRLLRSYMHHTDTTGFASRHHQEVLVQLLVEIGKSCGGYTEITEADIRDGYNPISLRHIYAATLERLSHEVSVSDTPPVTRPLDNDKVEGM